MNTVKESNLGAIKSVFNDNSSNIHYYKLIHNTFSKTIKDLEFAKPIIQINQGIIVWKSYQQKPYLNYSNLSEDKKVAINKVIQNSLNQMAKVFSKDKEEDFLKKIIEIPNQDAIFYTLDNENKISVILTEWGYAKDEHIHSESILKKIFSVPLKSLIIKFESKTGELLEGINTTISTQEYKQDFVSDSDGVVRLNNLNYADTITVKSPDGIFQDTQLDISSSEEHTIIVERSFYLTFNVVDSENKPLTAYEFSFVSQQFPGKTFKTDQNGSYSFKHPEGNDNFEILSIDNNSLLSETLPTQDQTYKIVYDPPIHEIAEEPAQPEEIPTELEENPFIELEFLNNKRRPIANQEVNLYGKNGKSSYTTNSDGIVTIDTLNNTIEYSVFMNYKNTDWKKDFVHNGR